MAKTNDPNNDSITLAISGEVSLDDFEQAFRGLRNLIHAIEAEKAQGENIHWIIQEMSAGSALVRFRGIGSNVQSVVSEYEQLGMLASKGKIPSSQPIREAIILMTEIINRNGSNSMRFETRERDAEVINPLTESAETSALNDAATIQRPDERGSVRGRIQSITNRKSLQFTMYDLTTDKPISCYLEPGSESLMRRAWGKIAIVAGMVRRNLLTGDPTIVRHIQPDDIRLVPEISGSWRDAIGASRSRKGEIQSDVAIRRGRDG